MGRFSVIAPQFTSFKTFIAACITLVVALAAPGVLQGQCQPLARAHDAQAPEPRNASPSTPTAGERATAAPAFYDEPKFTVAGVTDATNLGGHGSGAVQRNTEALTNEAILLKKESPAGSQLPSFDARAEKSLRASLEHDPGNAELHHSPGVAEEKLGNPLEAVRQYSARQNWIRANPICLTGEQSCCCITRLNPRWKSLPKAIACSRTPHAC